MYRRSILEFKLSLIKISGWNWEYQNFDWKYRESLEKGKEELSISPSEGWKSFELTKITKLTKMNRKTKCKQTNRKPTESDKDYKANKDETNNKIWAYKP